jgi:hypothetical protein
MADRLTPQKQSPHRGGTVMQYEPAVARKRFLTALERFGNVTRACRFARISRETAYNWREADKPFASAWRHALDDAADRLEQEAWRRAVTGTKKPVYQGGDLVGHIQEYSDTLLIFLMKAANPGKYRETVKHETSGELRLVFTNDWRSAPGAPGSSAGDDVEG